MVRVLVASMLAVIVVLPLSANAGRNTDQDSYELDAPSVGLVCWNVSLILEDTSAGFLDGIYFSEPDPSIDSTDILDFAITNNAYLTFGSSNKHVTPMEAQFSDTYLRTLNYESFTLTPYVTSPTSASSTYLVDFVVGVSVILRTNCTPGEAYPVTTSSLSFTTTPPDTGASSFTYKEQASFTSAVAGLTDGEHICSSSTDCNGNSAYGGIIHFLGVDFPVHKMGAGLDGIFCPHSRPPGSVDSGMVTVGASAESYPTSVIKLAVSFSGSGVASCTGLHENI